MAVLLLSWVHNDLSWVPGVFAKVHCAYTFTTLIRHASQADICSDRFASNSQYARSSSDEQVCLATVWILPSKKYFSKQKKTAKKKNN